jgi:hypothetical protein
VNAEYLVWFGVLVVVTGAALAWLAIGEIPGFLVDHDTPPDSHGGEDPAAQA